MRSSLCRRAFAALLNNSSNGICTSAAVQSKGKEDSFFGSFFERKIEAQKASHQDRLASTKEEIIEVQTHNVKPDSRLEYVQAHKELVAYLGDKEKNLHCESLGSFRIFVGDEDQFIHLWRYDDGYHGIDNTISRLRQDSEYQKLRRVVVPLLRSRHSQYMLPFGFWPQVYLRNDKHIYEMRSYHLKPGTMVEWGNYWARAIKLRDHKHTEAYVGMFSQIGELYNVKHIWCYDSLEDRKHAREAVWQRQQNQWGEIVANTTPLIRHMTSRIMRPLEHSKTQ